MSTDARTGPPPKRVKLNDTPGNAPRFLSVGDIRASLRIQDQHQLTDALTALRNQLTIKLGESPVSPQDDRLLLAQHWLESVPGAHDLFDIWENQSQRHTPLAVAIISVLSALLTLLSSHYTFQSFGHPILKTLLSPPWIRRLNSYLGGSHTELILVTLKLFNSMSAFASGSERKMILESFAWEAKSHPKLLHMRRKGKNENVMSGLARPDIRTLYLLFILSFVDVDSSTSIKATFLERHRDVFLSIFKGLIQDSYPVVRKVLEVCWAGIWSDSKLKRTLKIGLFNESTLIHIIKLYDRGGQEGTDPDHIPADLVHHFLLALCTHPGTGVCFKDHGWYPRDSEADNEAVDAGESKFQRGGRIHNKILANLLKTLKVNEDLRQQELALKILSACPELVSGYWTGAALILEPRLSSKWITNISFFGTIISLPVPLSSFFLPNHTVYHPTPPPLTNILENILPSINTKIHLSKGLQSPSPLVQHCTALALVKCLLKYENVIRIFQEVVQALEEDEDDGQWCKRKKEITAEVRKRVPDFQVIVGFVQQRAHDGSSVLNPSLPKANAVKTALLAESAQRLLWLYRRCLPSLVAETRFDLGKLLQHFSDAQVKDNSEPMDAPTRLHTIRQLHVLRLLKESDEFLWSGKPPSSPHSYLYILLTSYISTDIPATRLALKAFICSILSTSIMFQENADEPYLWLASLPTTQRAADAKAPDGAMLTNEGESVITFLDDCVQRCLKTPYRYVDDMSALWNSESDHASDDGDLPVEGPNAYLSPLLMTVIEQLGAKVTNKLLTPSDILALATFIRKLVFSLSTMQQNLKFLRAFVGKLDACLHSDRLAFPYPVVAAAIRREVSIVRFCLGDVGNSLVPRHGGNTRQAFITFLDQIEAWPIPETKPAWVVSAFRIVDWLRLVGHSVSPAELSRLAAVVESYHKPALKDLCESLHPSHALLWEGLNVSTRLSQLRLELSFEWLFVHSPPIEDAACRDILVELLFANAASRVQVKRALCLVIHHLSFSKGQDMHSRNLFFLLGSIMKRAESLLSSVDVDSLKEYIFLHSQVITGVAFSEGLSDVTVEGLACFVESTLDSARAIDRRFVSHISAHWLDVLKINFESGLTDQVALIKLWVKYLEADDMFGLLDLFSTEVDVSNPLAVKLLMIILHSLRRAMSFESRFKVALQMRLKQLLDLRPLLGYDPTLEDMIAAAITACLPVGHTGFSQDDSDPSRLISRCALAGTPWFHPFEVVVEEDQFYSFLIQESWSTSSVQIISGLLYKLPFCKSVFHRWLGTETCISRSTTDLACVFFAFLDSSLVQGGETIDLESERLAALVSRLFASTVDSGTPSKLRTICASCIVLMTTLMPSKRSELFAFLESKVQQLPVSSLTPQVLVMGNQLHSVVQANNLISSLVDHGLQWSVRHLSDGDDDDDNTQDIFDELIALVACAPNIKSHLADTVLTAAVKNGLSNTTVLNLLNILMKAAPLKPLIINRHLQSILQHPKFFKVCEIAEPGTSTSRDAIVQLVHVLFNIHPTNTCHPTHVEPLVHIYGGTTSVSDRKLLSIFQLFERQRKTSVASLVSSWSPSNVSSSNVLDAVLNLDSAKVLRTCLLFPKWRRFSYSVQEKEDNALDLQLYDPIFLILLFARVLSESLPTSALSWVELFRTHIVCLLIRCMSSKDVYIRELALSQIVALWKCLETVDMQEKPHVIYILNLLKDTLPPPSEEEPPLRLPSYSSLILLHALRGVFYPSNFIYPLTANFLLQRPQLDASDVPMLYAMLYSSSNDWRKERGWIIRFLSDGMVGSDDWRVLKRRHTWDLLASLFQSSEKDQSLRNGILEVLANLTCNCQATMSLVLKSGLLVWIEMQLMNNVCGNEGLAWLKILQNVITTVDRIRLESVANGEWRAVISRCLSLLLNHYRSSYMPSILGLAAPIIWQLSLLPGVATSHLPSLVVEAFDHLKRLEDSADIHTKGNACQPCSVLVALHAAHGLHEHVAFDDPLQLWGVSVEALWRAVMNLEVKHSAWEGLTCRLLVWRMNVGEAGSFVGEWARKEVVRNLCVGQLSRGA